MLIFGSTALKHWFPDLEREPKDIDYMGEGKSTREIEYHFNPAFQYILDNNKDSKYVDPDFLYTIKVSHAAWDVRWDKTMHDIMFMRDKGCTLNLELYKLLLKDWEVIHGTKKHIILNGSMDEFFNSNVTRKMNHDQLHELVKFYERPLHESIRPDLTNVKVSKVLWDNLSHEDKIKCAMEEIMVFALERYEEYPPNFALIKGIKQLITKSTKGYFTLFMIENFKTLIYDYREHFNLLYKQYKGTING